MPIRKKQESRDQRRYTRHSTKKRIILRRPAHLGRFFVILASVISVIALALIWGNYLKAKSDAYRTSVENGEWTLNSEIATPYPVSVPDIRAISIKPEGNVGDILIAGEHEGIIMTLKSESGVLFYESAVGQQAGCQVQEGAVALKKDVERVQKRDLYVTCVYNVTCFAATDPVMQVYQRGLDLAILREYAEAGMNDILLLGLPAGGQSEDQLTIDFLQELRDLLTDLPNPPALGVALPASAYSTDDTYVPIKDEEEDEKAGIPSGTVPLYAGNITPARILNACDFLAMDLRDQNGESLVAVLPHIRYAYVRYSLRLLIDRHSSASAEEALSHGFTRLFEMEQSFQNENDTAP